MLKKEQLDILFQSLEKGMNIRVSCALAEMSESAFYKKYNKELKFKNRVEKIRAQWKEKLEKIIEEAATKGKQKSWVAAAWLLERKHPDEYGQKQKIEHQGEVLKQIIVVQGEKEDRLGKKLEEAKEAEEDHDK